jgi:hypothetical protein
VGCGGWEEDSSGCGPKNFGAESRRNKPSTGPRKIQNPVFKENRLERVSTAKSGQKEDFNFEMVFHPGHDHLRLTSAIKILKWVRFLCLPGAHHVRPRVHS